MKFFAVLMFIGSMAWLGSAIFFSGETDFRLTILKGVAAGLHLFVARLCWVDAEKV